MLAELRSFLSDFVDWAGAVVRAWWLYAAIILAGGGTALYDATHSIPITFESLIVPILIALPVAFLQAWRWERRDLRVAKATTANLLEKVTEQARDLDLMASELTSIRLELDRERERNIPKLEGEINGTVIYNGTGMADQSGRPGLALFIPLTIRNKPPGAPSVAESWRLSVEKDGRRFGPFWPHVTPETMTFTSINGQTVQYTDADAIYNKTKPVPIQSGGSVSGQIFFVVPGSNELSTLEGSTIIVEFADVLGTVSEARRDLNHEEQDGSLIYVPGTAKPKILKNAATRFKSIGDGTFKEIKE